MVLTDMPLGDTILYFSLLTSVLAIIALALKEYKVNYNIFKAVPTLTRLTAVALVFDILLLAYYFVTSNYTINYVWQYNSNDLAMIYKLCLLYTSPSPRD